MATRVWQSTDGNWNATGSWSGAAVPVDGDVVIFPATNAVAPSTNLTQTGVELAAMFVEKGFAPNIGASGNYLKIGANKLIHFGDGTVYFEDNTTGTEETDLIILNSDNLNPALYIQGAATNPIGRIVVVKGYAVITGALGAAGITEVELHSRSNPATDARLLVELPSGGTRTIGSFYQNAGISDVNCAITNAYLAGGQFTKAGQAMTNLRQAGGLCVFNVPSSTGALAFAHLQGGVLDCTRTPDLKTITTLRRMRGAKIVYNKALVTIPATTTENDGDCDMTGYGPSSGGGGGIDVSGP
jgi:hypothetical protein